MPPQIEKTALANQDFDDLAIHYLREAGIDVSLRFLRNAEQVFMHLASMPEMGALVGLTKPEHAGIPKARRSSPTSYSCVSVPQASRQTMPTPNGWA